MAESPSPSYVLKKSAEACTDLYFWDTCYGCTGRSLYLIVGYSNQGGIDVWNLATRRVQAHYLSDIGIISVYGTENSEIISLNREGDLKLIDAESGSIKCNIIVPNVAFCKAFCLPFSDTILTAVPGECTSSIAIWDLRKEKLLWRLIPSKDSNVGMVMCIRLFQAFSGDLLSLGGHEDGSLILWDVTKEVLIHKLALYNMMPIMCLDFNSIMMFGVAGSPSEVLTKFGITKKDGEKYRIVISKTRTMSISGIADVKIRPDCKIIAAGGWGDGSVRIFSLKTLKPLAVLKYHDGTVQSVAFRYDVDNTKQTLASGSETHTIAIWSIYND